MGSIAFEAVLHHSAFLTALACERQLRSAPDACQ